MEEELPRQQSTWVLQLHQLSFKTVVAASVGRHHCKASDGGQLLLLLHTGDWCDARACALVIA